MQTKFWANRALIPFVSATLWGCTNIGNVRESNSTAPSHETKLVDAFSQPEAEYKKTFAYKQAQLEAEMKIKGKVVYAVKHVRVGAIFRGDQMEVREMDKFDMPFGAVHSPSAVIGHKALRNIRAGLFIPDYVIAGYQKPKEED